MRGVWGCDDDEENGVSGDCKDDISLPAPAPVALTDATVNFAPDGTFGVGSGKACLYGTHVEGGTNFNSALGGGTPFVGPGGSNESRFGFRVSGPSGANGFSGGGGAWAYTAP